MVDKMYVDVIKKLLSKPNIYKREFMDDFKLSSSQLEQLIERLQSDLKKVNTSIEVDEQHGWYSLKINDPELFEKYFNKLLREQNVDNSDQDERVRYILLRILTEKRHLKIEELADSLYISSRQISKDLKLVRNHLDKYELSLKSTPHYGLELVGTELKKRLCLADICLKNYSDASYILKESDNEVLDKEKALSDIKVIVSDILKKYDYLISDTIFNNLVVHLYVALLRIKNGHEIDHSMVRLDDSQELKISQDIVSALSQRFKMMISQDECAYISAHLMCKRSFDMDYSENISPEIGDLVIDMLERIDNKYGTEFRRDFKLCMIISLHCVSLINRIKYGFDQKNPLLDEIKSRFIYEFELASEGCKAINERYGCELSEDEIGYFALDIRTVVEKRYGNDKKNVLLVCSTGRGSAELMRVQFEKYFDKFVKKLDVCSSRDAEGYDLNSYDYIFTTVPLFVKTNTPIFLISFFLGQKDIVEINGLFRDTDTNRRLLEYIPKELFMGVCEFETKEEALEKMVAHISKYEDIPNNFLESVWGRENEANTSFGNKVAFPHPKELLTDTTFLTIAVLKKPIDWGKAKVQLIILASIENKKGKKLQPFYKMLSKIINNQENVDALIKEPTYEKLCELVFDEQKDK